MLDVENEEFNIRNTDISKILCKPARPYFLFEREKKLICHGLLCSSQPGMLTLHKNGGLQPEGKQ